MLRRFNLTIIHLLNSPKARAIFILSTLALAALAGGAPNDASGG